MKVIPVTPSFHILPAAAIVGIMLASGAATAQTYDFYYTVDRYTDSSGDVISQYANWSVDPIGNTYNYILPVYVGMASGNPTETDLSPGYGVAITALANGGGDVIGSPFALPAGQGGDPPGRWSWLINKLSGGNITLTSPTGNANDVNDVYVSNYKNNPNASPSGMYSTGNAQGGAGSTLKGGCYLFLVPAQPGNPNSGPASPKKLMNVDFTGCHVAFQPAPETGQFSDIYAVTGGGADFPSANAPSFYANADWQSVCMGDFDSPFDGAGYGEVVVQCNTDEFMSVETPGDTYVGCIPEPSTLALLGMGAVSLLAYAGRRQMAKT
jgi:hypothetical protein